MFQVGINVPVPLAFSSFNGSNTSVSGELNFGGKISPLRISERHFRTFLFS